MIILNFAEREKEVEREKNRKEGLGTFYNLPQYMRVYEVLKGAYSNYKVCKSFSILYGVQGMWWWGCFAVLLETAAISS